MPFKSYHILTAGVIVISLLFYSRFIPSPKEEWHYILPAIPAAEIRQNMWNCYTFWNMLTIVAFCFHSTNYTGKLLYAFQRKQGRELLVQNHKAWMQCLFSLSFWIPGVKGNSSIHCWSVQDVCLLWLDEKMICQRCVPIYSNFIEFLVLKDCVLGIKWIICFLLSCLSFMQSLIVRIPWTN